MVMVMVMVMVRVLDAVIARRSGNSNRKGGVHCESW